MSMVAVDTTDGLLASCIHTTVVTPLFLMGLEIFLLELLGLEQFLMDSGSLESHFRGDQGAADYFP